MDPETQDNNGGEFDEWAKVELMGHVVLVGHVTKAPIADFLRVDVPNANGATVFTKIINPKAVYALTPITRELALKLAAARAIEAPVTRFELPAPATPAAHDADLDNEDDGSADLWPEG